MVTITFLLYPSLSTAILLGSKCFHGCKENAYMNEEVKKKNVLSQLPGPWAPDLKEPSAFLQWFHFSEFPYA